MKNGKERNQVFKRKFFMTVAILSLVAIFTSACAQAAPEPVFVEQGCEELMNLKHISQEVEVPAGGILTVTLCSNPTTGFQWSENAEISNPQVIAQTEHKFLTPEEKNIVGGAGQEVWTFSALEPGQTTVYLEYSRPWEGGEKGEWTFTLTVIVK
jgi:inhibitor of cysteine peptidase